MNRNDDCRETLSTARGDARDSLAITAHLASCRDCREQVAAFRSMAEMARVVWAVQPAALGLTQQVLARARDLTPVWLTPARFAVSFASVVMLAILTASFTSPPTTAAPVARAKVQEQRRPVEVRIQRSEATRVVYVDTGAGGSDRRELDLDARYRVDVVPANSIVLNTF